MAKEYNISKSSGVCLDCKRELAVDEEYVATVRETGEGFAREDFCLACWEKNPRDNDKAVFGVWRGRVVKAEEKKKLFVDDELLVNFFQRLEGNEEPAKVSFRFVLALVLMRKRMLVYDRMEKDKDNEVWLMHFKGSPQVHRVVDPHMDEQKIADVSQNIGQILEGEL